FATVFQNMLDAAFKDPAQARALQQLANDAVAAFASGDPAQAAGQLAADAQAALSASPLFGPIAQNGLQLPALHLLPQIAGNPTLANIANILGSAKLGHLFPLVAAGAQAVQPPATAAPATPDASATTTASTSLPAVPAGHVVTIAGPAGSAPASAA